MKEEIKNKIIEDNQRIYDEISYEFSQSRSTPWPMMQRFKKFVFEKARILDLGCGNGRLLQIFPQINFDYFGLDSSEKMLEIAKGKYNNNPRVKFLLADFSQPLKFPDNYFDVVFAIASFHHLPSRELRLRLLKEIWRVVKPGGYFVLTLWNLYKLKLIKKYHLWHLLLGLKQRNLERGDVFIPWFLKNGKILQRYYHAFTFKEIKNLLEKNNWKIIEQYYCTAKARKSNWLKGDNLVVIAKKTFS